MCVWYKYLALHCDPRDTLFKAYIEPHTLIQLRPIKSNRKKRVFAHILKFKFCNPDRLFRGCSLKPKFSKIQIQIQQYQEKRTEFVDVRVQHAFLCMLSADTLKRCCIQFWSAKTRFFSAIIINNLSSDAHNVLTYSDVPKHVKLKKKKKTSTQVERNNFYGYVCRKMHLLGFGLRNQHPIITICHFHITKLFKAIYFDYVFWKWAT